MLKYTGHPFVDVGVATIAAFAGKRDPGQLTVDDLDRMADYIEREYVRNPLKSFLTVAFPNSGFTNPAYERDMDKRLTYARNVLRAFRTEAPTLDVPCVFTGESAAAVSFDVYGQLTPGMAFRQHIPLLTGEGVINFHPYGQAGLPVSGKAMLALQAFPLGCAKCAGRLLAVHSDNEEITYDFAAAFLVSNRQAVQLAQQAGSAKMPEHPRRQHTLLIETLLEADQKRRDALIEATPFSLTAYHFTNLGQNADLTIYHLPFETIGFLQTMHEARFERSWRTIVARAWEMALPKKPKSDDDSTFEPRVNHLYEDVFRLPGNAAHFVRTYFLRQPLHQARQGLSDPRLGYSPRRESDLISWSITEQFLRRIMHMEQERIDQIRSLGDRLAEYVSRLNDRRFFRDFYTLQNYGYLRTLLIRANLVQVKGGGKPLFGLDPYLLVFEEGDEVARIDWRLSRDLVLIRMIEQLHALGWLGEQPELLAETTDEPALEPPSEG